MPLALPQPLLSCGREKEQIFHHLLLQVLAEEEGDSVPSSRQLQGNMTLKIWLALEPLLVMFRILIGEFPAQPLAAPASDSCGEVAGGWRWTLMWQFWH